jgi:hypothetical protein
MLEPYELTITDLLLKAGPAVVPTPDLVELLGWKGQHVLSELLRA